MISFSFLISLAPYTVQVQMFLSLSISHFGSPKALGNGVMLDYFFFSILKEGVFFFCNEHSQFYIKSWELIKVYIKAHRKLFRGFKILFTSSIGTEAELRGERGRELTPSPTSLGAELARLWCPGTSIHHFENTAVLSVGTLSNWTWTFMFPGCHSLTPSSFHTILLSLTDAEGRISI